jgi:hypothetical protein
MSPKMIRRIWQFGAAITKTWGARVTGGVVIGVLGVWQLTGHTLKPWVGWTVIMGGVVVACFEVWNKQVEVSRELLNQLQQQADKRVNMRKALYRELILLYATFISIQRIMDETPSAVEAAGSLLKTVSTDAYRYAKSEPHTFYELKEALKIETLYTHLTILRNMQPLLPESIVGIVEDFLEGVDAAFNDPDYDSQLFASIAREASRLFPRKSSFTDKIQG